MLEFKVSPEDMKKFFKRTYKADLGSEGGSR